MGNILNAADVEALRARLAALQPDAAGQWGTMTPLQAVCHQLDFVQMCYGERAVPDFPLPLRLLGPLAKKMVLYKPWPKGKLKAPAVLFETQPVTWDADVAQLDQALARFATPPAPWPRHPFLGALTDDEWGVFAWRHVDHHLAQFGV